MRSEPVVVRPETVVRLPLQVKIAYTAFLCVLVPYYWITYTPWNFLYFCDIALLVALVALWLENGLLASSQAVGIVLPQLLWVGDFLARLVLGVHVTGMTAYMFDPQIPLFVRGLSLFHGWLPFFLLWLVWRLGYDRRGAKVQSVIVWVVLVVCYFWGPAPPPPPDNPKAAVNINYVYGLDDQQPQQWMPPALWLTALMAFYPVALILPAHFALRKWFDRKA